MSSKSVSNSLPSERDNSELISMFTGAAFASALTLALSILVFQISEIALYWAYAILVILFVISGLFVIYWWKKGIISRKIFGVSFRSVGQVMDDATVDIEKRDFRSLISYRGRELLSIYTSAKIRAAAISFTAILLGELVLLINAVMLIKQTAAIQAQTKVAEQQRIILERQTELLDKKDRKELFWQLFHDRDPLAKPEYFSQLVALGKRRFDGIRLVRANMTGKFLNSLSIQNSELIASFFDGADISNSSFDGSDLTDSSFRDVKVDASFRNSTLDGASFVNADVSGAIFDNTSLRRVNFTDAIGLDKSLLLDASSLKGVIGLPKQVLSELMDEKPELFVD